MSRNYTFAPGEYYHLYNRGVEKRLIFHDIHDRERFLKLLFYCNGVNSINIRDIPRGLTSVEKMVKRGESLVDIGAYCLMPNHFHILVREKDGCGISRFMQKLTTAYSMFFNIKYGRKGHLFGASYQSRHANTDEYLKYLYAYIHLNPVKLIDDEWRVKGIKDKDLARSFVSNYRFSSFNDYCGEKRESGDILSSTSFPEYFLDPESFRSQMFEWLTLEPVDNSPRG